MTNIKFVSNESFPDDPYTKEIVYLCIDDKYRFAYIRKQGRNGGMFWGPVSVAVLKDGVKKYFEGVQIDSSFMEKDIKDFLEKRKWETEKVHKNNNFQQEPLPF